MAISPKGINIQSLYNEYRKASLVVNRRYQRKLVWDNTEKESLIASILNDYPIPLFLLAERSDGNATEVIDGLQRLNAIFSFIENKFQYNEKYFNVETFLSAKRNEANGLFSKGYKSTKECITEDECAKILNYNLAVTTFKASNSKTVDIIFNRINSTGVKLSEQDRRQAGATSKFSNLVSNIASYIRGDVSKPIIPLHKMSNISISNKQNYTGSEIIAEDVFWCSNGVIHFKKLKNSGDEEVVSDILSGMILGSPIGVGKANLDKLYDPNNDTFKEIDNILSVKGEELFFQRFKDCFDDVQKLVKLSNQENNMFRSHVYKGSTSNEQTQIFYALFLAIYKIRFEDNKIISDYKKTWNALKDVSPRIKVGQQAQNPELRNQNINTIKGLISEFCAKKPKNYVSNVDNEQELKNILSSARVENEILEYKQGLVDFKSKKINKKLCEKIPKIICALANSNPENHSYLIFGICDDTKDAKEVEKCFSIKTEEYHGWHICGIDKDCSSLNVSLDGFYGKIKGIIENSDLNDDLNKSSISGIQLIDYKSMNVLVINIAPQSSPSYLGDDCYVRSGNDLKKLTAREAGDLTKKFS